MDTCFRKNTQIDRVNKAYVLKIAKKNFFVCQTILMRQQTNPEICFYNLFYLICVLMRKRFVVFASVHAFHHSSEIFGDDILWPWIGVDVFLFSLSN